MSYYQDKMLRLEQALSNSKSDSEFDTILARITELAPLASEERYRRRLRVEAEEMLTQLPLSSPIVSLGILVDPE